MDEKEKRKEYLEIRQGYDKEKSQQTEVLDKYILTISTGSFGLSLLFVEKLIKGIINEPKLLICSWIMFSLSIISSLLSFIFSKSAFSKTIEEYDKMYKDSDYKFKMPIQDFFTKVANWYAFGFLIAGFVFIILFAYYNI